MAKKNKAQEVQQRIKEMTEKKQTELAQINDKRSEAQVKKEAAELAIKQATEIMDLEAFEAAKQEKHKAQTAIDMYDGRYKQISQQEYISEAESDRVIDGLLDYEAQLEQDFIADLKEPLNKLRSILAAYFDAVRETEITIRTWETTIHANYSTRGAASRVDPNTGERTDRMEQPVPVHSLPFSGCAEAHILEIYLDKAPYKPL